MNIISKHTYYLAKYTFRNLATIHHYNGKPLAVFYHDSAFENSDFQGGIVNFNLLRPNGEYFGYAKVKYIFLKHIFNEYLFKNYK